MFICGDREYDAIDLQTRVSSQAVICRQDVYYRITLVQRESYSYRRN